jgi:hypothetical protein
MASVISRIISETAPGNARSCANLDISFEHKTFHDKDGYEWDVGHRSLARIIIGGLQLLSSPPAIASRPVHFNWLNILLINGNNTHNTSA